MGSPSARLVGRADALAVLTAELERTGGGEFRCVLLTGKAGVGKTRLAREVLTARSVARPSARAHPLGGTTEFGLWSEAFEGCLRGRDAAHVAGLCGGFLDDLAVLVRSVAVARGSAAPVSVQPRSRLLAGLAVLLGNLARSSPVVIFLDDLPAADASSMEALSVDLGDLRDEIRDGLTRLGLRAPAVSVGSADHIERQAAGKLRRFVPLDTPPRLDQ